MTHLSNTANIGNFSSQFLDVNVLSFLRTGIIHPEVFNRQMTAGQLVDEKKKQYKIKVTGNHAKAFYLLIRNGSGKAEQNDIYEVSEWQLDVLRENGIKFETL